MRRKDAIDRLVKAAQERDYGELMNFDEIGGIINQKYGTTAYRDILQEARKRLEVAGHALENVRGIGYKINEPDNYTGVGVRKLREGARRIDRGAKIINHAPVNDMSVEAREAHNRVSDRLITVQAAIHGACVEVHMLSAPKHPLLNAKT